MKKSTKKTQSKNILYTAAPFFAGLYRRARARVESFLKRRPYRSFRLAKKRDMPKNKPLPSNIIFTTEVFGIIKKYRRSFIYFIVIYAILYSLLAGILDQESYADLTESLRSLGPSVLGGDFGKVGQVSTTFLTVVNNHLSGGLSATQQIYITTLGLFTWLSVVWFLRQRLSGAEVKVRDALYTAGAPLLATIIVAIVGLFQLLPGTIGVLLYGAATQFGFINGGVEAMLFAIAAALLVALSLYWVTSTLLALVVVTIPGTYPFRALSIAGDVVVGRRLSILLRLLWMGFMVIIGWVMILIPVILLADVLPWKWLPIVPLTIQLLSGASMVFAAAYVYILYRRIIDDGEPKSAPAKKRSKK